MTRRQGNRAFAILALAVSSGSCIRDIGVRQIAQLSESIDDQCLEAAVRSRNAGREVTRDGHVVVVVPPPALPRGEAKGAEMHVLQRVVRGEIQVEVNIKWTERMGQTAPPGYFDGVTAETRSQIEAILTKLHIATAEGLPDTYRRVGAGTRLFGR